MATKRILDFPELDLIHRSVDDEAVEIGGHQFLPLDTMRLLPRPEWIVPGLAERQALTLVSARGNRGKTAMVMTLILDRMLDWLRNWDEFVGAAALPLDRVLYFTQEGLLGFAPRFDAWCMSRGVSESERLWISQRFLVHTSSLQLGYSAKAQKVGQDLEWFVAAVDEAQPQLVVVDPWADFFSPGEENSNDDVRTWLQQIRAHILNRGVGMVIITHTAKGDIEEARGASSLYDGADRAYYVIGEMEELQDKQEGNLVAVKMYCKKAKDGGRDMPRFFGTKDFTAVRSFALIESSETEARKAVNAAKPGSCKARIIEYLDSRGGAAPTADVLAFMEEEYGYSRKTVENTAGRYGFSTNGNRGYWSLVPLKASEPGELE